MCHSSGAIVIGMALDKVRYSRLTLFELGGETAIELLLEGDRQTCALSIHQSH